MINSIKQLFKEAIQSSLIIFKIMIPVSIVVKILKETGMIEVIGKLFAPLMILVGLPGDMGIVWFSGMATNLYGGILAFFSLSSRTELSVAQITTLTTMMLLAHSFPVELQVAGKSGVKKRTIFLVRFFGGLIIGTMLSLIYKATGTLQNISKISWSPKANQEETIIQWLLSEMRYYLVVFLIILGLMALMKILKKLGIVEWMSTFFMPFFSIVGIGRSVIPLTIIGMTLGIAYGGALIISEAKKGMIAPKDLFFSMIFLSLCHSIIEDTLLMLSLGGHFSGILIIRPIFGFIGTWILVKLLKNWPEEKFEKYFMR